jgi:hypothetical protein
VLHWAPLVLSNNQSGVLRNMDFLLLELLRSFLCIHEMWGRLEHAYDVPERTGKGDAIAGVRIPFIAIGSSSSSAGETVSSD